MPLPRSLLPAPCPAFLTSDLRPLTSSSILLLFLSSFFILPSAFPAAPGWWTSRGVITTNAVPNDFAPVNAGQLQNMARALYEEIEFRVPNGPSPALSSHLSDLLSATNHYAVINLGQLKHTVKPFYDFLAPFGGPAVPWPAPGLTANDYAPANLGQLKYVFALLSPAALLAAPAMAEDSDDDGLTNAEEMALGTNKDVQDKVVFGFGVTPVSLRGKGSNPGVEVFSNEHELPVPLAKGKASLLAMPAAFNLIGSTRPGAGVLPSRYGSVDESYLFSIPGAYGGDHGEVQFHLVVDGPPGSSPEVWTHDGSSWSSFWVYGDGLLAIEVDPETKLIRKLAYVLAPASESPVCLPLNRIHLTDGEMFMPIPPPPSGNTRTPEGKPTVRPPEAAPPAPKP